MKSEERFYNQKHLARISRRGYYEEKISFFIKVLSKLKSEKPKILDIACNDGELTEVFGKYGEVLGIDINEKAVKKCKERGLKCKKTDIHGLSKKYNQFFDVVIAGDIIEHVFDTDAFLGKVNKFLKKNGILLLTTPNLASFGRRILLLFGINPYVEFSTKLPYEDFNVGHIRYYTLDNLKTQLRVGGFRIEKLVGDRINITDKIYVPYAIARHFPSFSRNLMVYATKK